jgi:hypothetical protein
MSRIIQSPARSNLVFLVLLFTVAANGFHIAAQNYTVISKRPLVTRIFDSQKNQSTVSALLMDPESDEYRHRLGYASPYHPPPDIRLVSVGYTYPGNIQSRPQAISFAFVSLNKYKTAPSFSVAADGIVLHQGEATLMEPICCVEINGETPDPPLVIAVPIGMLERLTQARKVELKLTTNRGKYSFRLNDYQKECLTALVKTMT